MIKTALAVFWLGLAAILAGAGALAQIPPDPATAPPDAPDRDKAIVNGKRVQPHAVPGETDKSPEAQLRLLQKEAKELPSQEPIVQPHDLYGNPLGGNPGLDPPKPQMPSVPPPKP